MASSEEATYDSEKEEPSEPPRKKSKRGVKTAEKTPQFLKGNAMSTIISNDHASYQDKEIWVFQLPRDVRIASLFGSGEAIQANV